MLFLNFLHFWQFRTIPSRTVKLESEYQMLSKTMKINDIWLKWWCPLEQNWKSRLNSIYTRKSNKIDHFSELFSFQTIAGHFEQNWKSRTNFIYTRKSNKIDHFSELFHFWQFLAVSSKTERIDRIASIPGNPIKSMFFLNFLHF